MITYDDVLNLNFYKKEKFTGSYLGMRYLIQKDAGADATAPAPAEGDEEKPTMVDVFRVAIWPGPYNSETTPDDKKTFASFPFTQDGKKEMVDWMNEQWKNRRGEWPER